MEDGGVDTTVIESRHHQIGRIGVFPPLLAFSIFDFSGCDLPQIKSQTIQHALMNLANTTLFYKCEDS